MDAHPIYGEKYDESVKYIDVTSGGESMTMIVRILGGLDALVRPPVRNFKNKDSSTQSEHYLTAF